MIHDAVFGDKKREKNSDVSISTISPRDSDFATVYEEYGAAVNEVHSTHVYIHTKAHDHKNTLGTIHPILFQSASPGRRRVSNNVAPDRLRTVFSEAHSVWIRNNLVSEHHSDSKLFSHPGKLSQESVAIHPQ